MEAFARLLLLLVAAVLVIRLVQDGPGGAARWLKAKFLGGER